MGLDVLFVPPAEQSRPLEPHPDWLRVVGLGKNNLGFRGGVYATFFSAELNVNLRHRLEPEEVQEVAETLGGITSDSIDYEAYRRPADERELQDLWRLFDWYADQDAATLPWA